MSDRLPENLLPDPLFVQTAVDGDVEHILVSTQPPAAMRLRSFSEALILDRDGGVRLELLEVVQLR